ncbi:hypothetical protein LXL04_004410 [Taraxacum kok-saghyz]
MKIDGNPESYVTIFDEVVVVTTLIDGHGETYSEWKLTSLELKRNPFIRWSQRHSRNKRAGSYITSGYDFSFYNTFTQS